MNAWELLGFLQLFIWLLIRGRVPYYETKLMPWDCLQIAKIVWLEK